MRYGRTKRPRCGTLYVHMNPLLVARGLGKLVNLRLRDGDPITGGHMLAHAGR